MIRSIKERFHHFFLKILDKFLFFPAYEDTENILTLFSTQLLALPITSSSACSSKLGPWKIVSVCRCDSSNPSSLRSDKSVLLVSVASSDSDRSAVAPPVGVAKLTAGALGPAAGVDVNSPAGSELCGRRIESGGIWDSFTVPDSNSCKGHCVSCSSFWLVSCIRSSSCLFIVSSVEAACFTTSERSFNRRSFARCNASLTRRRR